ncbi:MAG: hypothetical protein HY590_01470 [Candidatus Omnitrophica bacterium]|nr:hypothetical protein [Candidatus Omnitrophota bacterium]
MLEINYSGIPQENLNKNVRICEICSNEFAPSKYRPNQKICSNLACQTERQKRNILSWRARNPAYFRHIHANPHWRNKRSLRSRQWRLTHSAHIRQYREAHREYYRLYMREYMRQYRRRRRGGEVAVEGTS